MSQRPNLQFLAETERLIEAFAAGDVELTYDDTVDVSTLELPPPGAPHYMIRVLSVPFDIDERARQAAAERGVDVEDLLVEWLTAGQPDA
ncbi:hypothetical protein [Dactylosporangium sp. NPDC051484]|uniref:hypothetical protein n=1 Tax=Dactylosporangium sp. NPDC051484 TaxID=3154942 RepID=UPI00344B9552